MHVVMLLTNPFKPDPRVLKEATSLRRAGYRVTVLCWDRLGEYPSFETIGGIEIKRIPIISTFSKGWRQIIYLPRFWNSISRQLDELKPDIIHCHDLDTTPAGYLYARRHKIPWIFDAHECYPEQMKQQVGPIIYQGILRLDKFMAQRSSTVFTINGRLANLYRETGAAVVIIGNYSRIREKNKTGNSRSQTGRSASSDELRVLYAGGFTNARAIIPLIRSTQHSPSFHVVIAGDGPQKEAILREINTSQRVDYLGWIHQDDLENQYAAADIIYYGLYENTKNSSYSSPNALFNAMIFGLPLITTNIGVIAEIVREENCGVVIDEASPEHIARAVERLSDPQLRDQFGKNSRMAAEYKYNWDIAESALLTVYKQLLSHTG